MRKNPSLVKRPARLLVILAYTMVSATALAHEPVVGVADPESLFTDASPKLNTNKQATLHIMKDLLQCNGWDEADRWLTSRYVVTVVIPRELKDPKDPSKTYTTTWFDMWRFVDGKADEHWDPATK